MSAYSPNAPKRRYMRPEKMEHARELRDRASVPHVLLWNCLRSNRLDGRHWRRRALMYGYIVDFYCAAAGLVVEFTRPSTVDARRDSALRSAGLRVLRFPYERVSRDLPGILREISAAAGQES